MALGNGGAWGGHRGRRRIVIERHDDGQSQQLKEAEIGRRQDERRQKRTKAERGFQCGPLNREISERKED